jgi:hypothetical protein
MPYTRRDLIRDAALISATGAVAGAPSILGCHAAPPKPKFSGVRVFFCGSWIFCSDGACGMYAIARDMFNSNGCSTHIFPFGRWQNTTVPFDHGMPHLLQNPAKSDGTADPYVLTVAPAVAHPISTATGSPSPVESIFQQAQMEVRFAYLNNSYDAKGKCPIKINTSVSTYSGKASGIRVIALPIPKRIRARGLVTRATFSDNTGINLLNQPSVDHTSSKMDGILATLPVAPALVSGSVEMSSTELLPISKSSIHPTRPPGRCHTGGRFAPIREWTQPTECRRARLPPCS